MLSEHHLYSVIKSQRKESQELQSESLGGPSKKLKTISYLHYNRYLVFRVKCDEITSPLFWNGRLKQGKREQTQMYPSARGLVSK